MRFVMILACLLFIPGITWGEKTAQEGQESQAEQPATGPIAQSEEELVAYNQFARQLDPDMTIQAGEEFVQLYPESQLRALVYSLVAIAYRDKNDYEKSLEYGEKALELEPENVLALSVLAHTLPQRMKGSGLEQAQKLARTLELANRGLAEMEKLVKRPDQAEEEFQTHKATLSRLLHSALGRVHLQRRQLDKAQVEYKMAVTAIENPDPTDYFYLGQAYEEDRKFEEAIEAFENASRLSPGTIIEQIAEQKLERLRKVVVVLGKSKK